DGPGEAEADAERSGHALASLEPQPDREAVSEHRADGGESRCLGPPPPREPNRQKAFRAVEQQRRRREPLAAGAQHVGGADVARADGANVAPSGRLGEQQPERNRAERVAEQEGEQPVHNFPKPMPRITRRPCTSAARKQSDAEQILGYQTNAVGTEPWLT